MIHPCLSLSRKLRLRDTQPACPLDSVPSVALQTSTLSTNGAEQSRCKVPEATSTTLAAAASSASSCACPQVAGWTWAPTHLKRAHRTATTCTWTDSNVVIVIAVRIKDIVLAGAAASCCCC